jgi:diguanylate cyclase (GGDEF)-like protein
MEQSIRWLVTLCAFALGTVAIVMLFSPAGPHGVIGKSIVAGSAVTGLIFAAVWAIRGWPSQRLSILFIACADVGITTVSWQYSDRFVGMYGLNSLVLISLYVVFFHGPRMLAAHSAWVLASAIAFAVAVGTGPDGDPALAIAQTLASLVIIVAAPPALQVGFWMVRSDADNSLVDSLTGLLNRRGLYLHAGDLISPDSSAGVDVVVMVLDLDRFKDVNDKHGHAVGDEVLVRSALRIKSVIRGGAVLSRFGGEEFVLVDVLPRANAAAVAERVREALAAPVETAPITVSIGFSCVSGAEFVAHRHRLPTLLDAMVAVADGAMYEAKRLGRDCVVADLTGVDLPSDDGATHQVELARLYRSNGNRHDRRGGFERRSGIERRTEAERRTR